MQEKYKGEKMSRQTIPGFSKASDYDPDEAETKPEDCNHEFRMTMGQRKNFEICVLCGTKKK